MSNAAKNSDYSSEEEDEESDSDEEEQPKAVKGKVDPKVQERPPQDEEESSEEEDSETDNDAQRFKTVRREGNAAGALKATNPSNAAGKRGRDAEGKDEEPVSKKSKDNKGDKGRMPVKPASPSRSSKSEPVIKGGKAQASKSKPEKTKSVSVEREEITKASAPNKKRKASPPPVNGSAKQRADGNGKTSPLKPKTPFLWTSNLETALATMLWNDKKHGRPIPSGTRNDPYWSKLVKELCSEGVVITEAQLSEKVRRMKTRWKTLKSKDSEKPWKNLHEQKLYGIWNGIWGAGLGKQPARPETSKGAPNEEDEEEESSEEEEVATPVVRASKGTAQPSGNEESSESEEEEEEEEEHEEVEAPEVGPKTGGPSHEGTNKDGTKFDRTSVVSPFVSKPRLEYTPVTKEDKKKAQRKGGEGSIAELSGAEASADEEEGDGRTTTAVTELLNSLKKESFAVLHEVRASCLEALNNIRKQTTTVLDDMKDTNNRLGVNMPTSGMWRMNGGSVPSLDRGLLEDVMTNTLRSGANGVNSSLAAELKTNWRQLRAEEMDLLEKRIQLTLKQLQLARKEFEEPEN